EILDSAISKQNWKGILISLLVILTVCFLILLAIILVTPKHVNEPSKSPLSFQDFLKLEFELKSIHYKWISDNQFAYHDQNLGIQVFNTSNRIYKTVVNNQFLKSSNINGFDFSMDLKYILLEYDKKSIFRFSYSAKYLIYDVEDGQVNALGPQYPSQDIDVNLRCIIWSPEGHALVFVYENNIYYLPDVMTTPIKITNSDPNDLIYNGVPDWIYEEEILMSPCAIYWSINSALFAYVQINFSSVPKQPIIEYGSKERIYPLVKSVPYPKTQKMGQARIEYLTNGDYDVTELSGFDIKNRILYYIVSPAFKSSARYIYTLKIDSKPSSNQTESCYSCSSGVKNCDFYSPLFSADYSWALFWCLGPIVPTVTLHKLIADVDEYKKHYNISPYEKSHKLMNTNRFPKKYNATAVKDSIYIILNNTKMKQIIFGKALPSTIYMEISLANYTLPAKLLLPPSFKENGLKKYPLMVEIYGGPQSQIVDSQFSISWSTFLCSHYNVVIAMIDGRGTAHKGRSYMVGVYKRLGDKDSMDQIFGIKHILKKFPLIDSHNIAIWGWSYGAFLTSSILAKQDSLGLIKCGIAVAPVTDWRYYDSAYSEKYMGSLSDNIDTYQLSSILDKVENIKFHKFLLIHGTGDDNVHFQHTAQMIKSLVEKNIMFDLMVYPDENHELHNVREHLYLKMTDFLINSCYNHAFQPHIDIIKQFDLINDQLLHQQQQSLNEKITDSNDD
ncbi:unnamed protein product, partial [Gordionus sp. m RMFG-2023]